MCGAAISVFAEQDYKRNLFNYLDSHTSAFILVKPADGRIVDANKAALDFYGYTFNEFSHLTIYDINCLDRDEIRAEMLKAKQEERNYFIFPHKLKSGELRTVEVYSAPLIGSDGNDYLLSVVHDVSGKLIANEDLLAYANRISSLAEQRAQDLYRVRLIAIVLSSFSILFTASLFFIVRLRRAKRSVSDALEERINLFQELQHRVKNTLTTINSFVDLELSCCECEEAHQALSRLRSRTETLSSLYLLLHKSGSTNLVDAGAYLASLMSTLLKGYTSSECKISLQAEYLDIQISAKEASALGLLVTELVTNSFKYGFKGKDTGTIYCLMRNLSQEKGRVELIVGDDGVGIDREKFQKAGSGLGLVLAKQLAAQLGGSLELLQTDGAMFRFVLFSSK